MYRRLWVMGSEGHEWALQLLAVAYLWLSLAIKLEEHHVHALRLLGF
jgi:hypothetical protein